MDYNIVIDLVKSAKSIVENETLKCDVHMKNKNDFVTAVDIGISNYIKEELFKLYPEVGFFSEEESGELSDPCWILDPIDGTTNLVYGYNMSSVSLALYAEGTIQFGVVYNPFNDDIYTCIKGQGPYFNGKPIKVSNRQIGDSLVEFGAGSTHKEATEENFEIVKDIFKKCVDIRRICSSALSICFIARGAIDGYFEKHLKPWDYAAAYLILTEAGGKLTDYEGNDMQFANPSSIICSNGVIHDEIKISIDKVNN